MQKRPIIGVTASFYPNAENPPLSQNCVNRDYIGSLIQAGALPVMIPSTMDPLLAELYAAQIDGLLVPGGEDVNPKFYGQEPHETVKFTSEQRDVTEITLIRKMVELGKPVFGICRGMQVINVAMGGDMIQDIQSHDPTWPKHFGEMTQRSGIWHQITMEPGSRIHTVFGKAELGVNSFHHQAVGKVAPGFTVTARSPEGIVEAIECPDKPIWGVEFHPENMVAEYPEFLGLFRWLVEAAK